MADSTRYRLDFNVPPSLDVEERDPHVLNPTLNHLRASLAEDGRWERSMLIPWKPYGQQQHLIVWVDAREAIEQVVLGNAVHEIVNDLLPGVTLIEVVPVPPDRG